MLQGLMICAIIFDELYVYTVLNIEVILSLSIVQFFKKKIIHL